MSFATIAAQNGGFEGSTASPTVNLPSGISAGDLILVVFCNHSFSELSAPTVSISGYTELDTGTCWSSGGSFGGRITVLARVADGSEGSTVGATLSSAISSAHATYRITNWFGSLAGVEIDATPTVWTTGTSANPGSLTASWGAADNLWLVAYTWQRSTTSHSSYPANYTLGQQNYRNNTSGGAGVATAGREAAVATEDPGAGAVSTSTVGVAYTIVVRPAAATTNNFDSGTGRGINRGINRGVA